MPEPGGAVSNTPGMCGAATDDDDDDDDEDDDDDDDDAVRCPMKCMAAVAAAAEGPHAHSAGPARCSAADAGDVADTDADADESTDAAQPAITETSSNPETLCIHDTDDSCAGADTESAADDSDVTLACHARTSLPTSATPLLTVTLTVSGTTMPQQRR